MKIGDKVILIDDNWPADRGPFGQYEQYPVKGPVYTIRDIEQDSYAENGFCICLEEIINPKMRYDDCFGETMFDSARFRVVDSIDLRLEKQISEALTPKIPESV